jgi:uncharacterized membrane protein HdeD (DUF308 family)
VPKTLFDFWWVFLIRGLASIVFGVLAYGWPALTLQILVLLFGAYALIDGMLTLYTTLTAGNAPDNRPLLALEGIAGIVFGSMVLAWPQISAVVLLFLIAGWAILTGIIKIMLAIRLRHEIEGEWGLILAGFASLSFGAIAFIYPASGALVLIFFIAAYAIVYGLALIALAWRMRTLSKAAR